MTASYGGCWRRRVRGPEHAGGSGHGVYTRRSTYMLRDVAKHLIDLDEEALSAARAELGTVTIKETVNQALRLAAVDRDPRVVRALDVLAGADLAERDKAWR